MQSFNNKKCPFDREPCRDNCALFVECEVDNQAFGYCGLLKPLLSGAGFDCDFGPTGQHIYPNFYKGMEEAST